MTIKNFVLGFAIFLLTLFVGIYGISTFYKESPKYDDYCPYKLNTYENCIKEGGKWINNTPSKGDFVDYNGYCDYDYSKCQEEYDDANRQHYKIVFLIALPLGILIIALGAIVFGLESVGAGLMLGGVGLIIYGAGGYWQYTDDVVKFILSLIGLIILITLTYYWNKKIFTKKSELTREIIPKKEKVNKKKNF